MKSLPKNTILLVCTAILLLLTGGTAGFLLRGHVEEKARENTPVTIQRENGYSFINPLLECDTAKDYLTNKQLFPFKRDVEAFIENKLDKTWARSVSIYFRELHDGLWFSIGDVDNFTPASLLKVPLMFAYFKKAESDSSVLTRKLKFTKGDDNNSYQLVKPSQVLIPSHEYTVDDLIFRSIVYSDNNAAKLLRAHVDIGVLSKTYQDLGFTNPNIETEENDMTIVAYSSFFRVLYNSSYLTRSMSEKALQYLSQTEFRTGLVAGVPAGIRVAHKFGEREYVGSDEIQLHDCGIIYYPNHPYLLCIMSRGNNYEYLDDTIAAISRLVYQHIDEQHQH
jgi:beta-lactamase class A